MKFRCIFLLKSVFCFQRPCSEFSSRSSYGHFGDSSLGMAKLGKQSRASAGNIPAELITTALPGPIISYYTLGSSSGFETLYEIKNSKFITKVFHAETVDEALTFVNKYKEVRASHNCWAYRGTNNIERVNDDGEPGGTAGRPMLSAIQEHEMMKCLVLIIRYFGGIKLGTGGLSRAYAAATQQVLNKCIKVPVYETSSVKLSSTISDLGILYQLMESFNNDKKWHNKITIIEKTQDEHYDLETDVVTLTLRIHSFILSDLQHQLIDMTKGRGKLEVVEQVQE